MYKIINGRLYFDRNTRFIPDNYFKCNENITDIFIPNTIIYVGKQSFSGCFNLKRIVFEEASSCVFFLDNCFEFCKNLEKITIPNSVQFIGSDCFFGDINLHEINIPRSMKHIAHHAFSASGIRQIYIDNGAAPYCDDMSFSGAPIEAVVEDEQIYEVDSGWNYKSYIIESQKNFHDDIIKKGLDLGDWISKKTKPEIWYKCINKNNQKIFGLNTDLHKAYMELQSKKNNNIIDIATSENWTLDTPISIDQYCAMSGNCWYYTAKFMEEHGYKPDERVPIRTIIDISKNQRNAVVFLDFVRKYIVNDDDKRNNSYSSIVKNK